MTLQCELKFSTILYLPIQDLTWWFHLFWFLYIRRTMSIKGEEKGAYNKPEISNIKEIIKLDASPNTLQYSLPNNYKSGVTRY